MQVKATGKSYALDISNAIRGRPVDGVEQAQSIRSLVKNTGDFVGTNKGTVAEVALQRTDTTHDLSSEIRERRWYRGAFDPTRSTKFPHHSTTGVPTINKSPRNLRRGVIFQR